MKTKTVKNTKKIAFVVHPEKKTELIEWSYFNKDVLQSHEIIAADDTAKILEGTLNKQVTQYLAGPYEGFAELCTMIESGKVDAVIMFWSTDETPLQKNGLRILIHTALEADIIIANNKATADFIITSPLMNKESNAEEIEGINGLKKNNAA